ncbi:MAG: nitroreductase family protein [Mogibacterium sp.]|nr:nitroreductase family protein [Mogibacterium sp.]
MEFRDLIKERQSCRMYRNEAVAHEAILAILEEAQRAPSWKNWQASRNYVVESPEMLAKFREKALPPFNQKSSAGAILIVTTYVKDLVGFTDGKPNNEVGNGWGAYDLGLHDAFLILAAKNAGYDTLIMGIRDAAGARELLGIPEEEEVMSVIALGVRDESAPLPNRPRKAVNEIAKFF